MITDINVYIKIVFENWGLQGSSWLGFSVGVVTGNVTGMFSHIIIL